jgi:hypothetical protein
MKVIHKNSREEFNVFAPNYIKLNSVYGYLVVMITNVYFIYCIDDNIYNDNVTDDFEILT